jgi:uncharacterized protein (TIGR02246 family)
MTSFADAHAGITQLHARFIDAVWRQNATDFADCFAQNGVWKIAGNVIGGADNGGRSAIAEACRTMLGRCSHIQLIVQPTIVEVTGEGTAVGRHHMVEMARMLDGSTAMTLGIYYDHFVEEQHRWRYLRRHWSMQYRGPFDLTGMFVDSPDYGSFPAMPPADAPTYVRPTTA